MKKPNDGGPAFPRCNEIHEGIDYGGGQRHEPAGLVRGAGAECRQLESWGDNVSFTKGAVGYEAELAKNCYKMADAMLEAREKRAKAAMKCMSCLAPLNEDYTQSCECPRVQTFSGGMDYREVYHEYVRSPRSLRLRRHGPRGFCCV